MHIPPCLSVNMDTINIIKEFYDPRSNLYNILLTHSKLVTEKALKIAEKNSHLNPDMHFIEEAAMLHDIGIFLTDAPQIGCNGEHPYIYHGYLGGEILRKKGFDKHARVCESHPGTGISAKAIIDHRLNLPKKDMIPATVEEQIICFADKFYSKTACPLSKEISIQNIIETLGTYGGDQVATFNSWMKRFSYS